MNKQAVKIKKGLLTKAEQLEEKRHSQPEPDEEQL